MPARRWIAEGKDDVVGGEDNVPRSRADAAWGLDELGGDEGLSLV